MLRSDPMLFIRGDEAEEAWRIIDPVMRGMVGRRRPDAGVRRRHGAPGPGVSGCDVPVRVLRLASRDVLDGVGSEPEVAGQGTLALAPHLPMLVSGDTMSQPERRWRPLPVEPMCPPDACRSGDGPRTLAPGESLTCASGIRAA